MILPIQGCNMYHRVAVKTNRMICGRCTCFQASLLAGLVLWVRGCGWPEIWRQSRPQQQLRWIVVAAAVAAVEVGPEVPTWPQSAVNSWPDHNNLKLLRDVLQDLGIAKKGGGGSDPCQDWFGGFDIVYRGQPKVVMDPQKW